MGEFFTSVVSGVADYLLIASIVAAALVTTVWAIMRAGKIHAPAHRHLTWLYILLMILILPLVWVYVPKVPMAIFPAETQTVFSLPDAINAPPSAQPADRTLPKMQPSAAATTSHAASRQQHFRFVSADTILVGLWSAGFLFMLIRLFAGWHGIKRIVRGARPVFDKVPQGKGYPAGLTLLLSEEIGSPLYFGVFRPVILLPEKMFQGGTSQELDMVLHHELAHMERRDCLVNIFQRIVEAVFFFHPLVWYASAQLTQQREILCDHHVIAKGASPGDYAQLLTRIVEQGLQKRCLHGVALFEGRLLSRVQTLLKPGGKMRLKPSRWAVIIGAGTVFLCMASGAIHLEAKLAEQWNFSIEGVVTDINTGKPIPKTLIIIRENSRSSNKLFSSGSYTRLRYTGLSAYTDENGYYRFDGSGAGDFLVEADAEPWGYVRKRKAFKVDAGGLENQVNLVLKPAATISGRFVDGDGNPVEIDVTSRSYSSTFTKSHQVAGNSGGSGGDPVNKYAVQTSGKTTSNNSYKDGEGDYMNANMVYPTPDTFFIEGVMPGKTRLIFSPREENRTVTRIVYNGRDILEGVIDVNPGDEIEGVSIVIETADTPEAEGQLGTYWTSFYRCMMEAKYGDLFEAMALSPERREKLRDLLIEESRACISIMAERETTSKKKMPALIKRHNEMHEGYSAKRRELLGNTDYAIFESYQDRGSARFYVSGFMASLSPDNKLSDDQKRALIELMYQQQEKVYSESGYDPTDTLGDPDDPEELRVDINHFDKIYAMTMAKAGSILSEIQLELFDNYLGIERDTMEKSLRQKETL